MKIKRLLFFIYAYLCLAITSNTYSQPKPGDYFREYSWKTPNGSENSKFLRVGGKMGYRVLPGEYPDLKFIEENILLNQSIVLDKAIKAEVVVEKFLCHDGTKNLSIRLNEGEKHIFPESINIPEPKEYYMHHFCSTMEIPLEELKQGNNNFFSLGVDSVQWYNWPQNLVYGVIFRIYYKTPKHPDIEIRADQLNDNNIRIMLNSDCDSSISSVDFIAKYDGPDMDGDGKYDDWHYNFFRGEIMNQVGTTSEKPFQFLWDIGWLPDQDNSILISARINYQSGFTYFAIPSQFELKREEYSVEFCKPMNQPQKWLTRLDEKTEDIFIKSDIGQITDAKMVFTTWSPGYFNGIYLNDFVIFNREGPKYAFMQHDVPINYLHALKQGENVLKTGKTPLHNWGKVHGVEVLWPGIMVLVKTKK